MEINVNVNADLIVNGLNRLQRKIPITIVSALNSTAFAVQNDLKTSLPRFVDRPKPYTKSSIQYEKATVKTYTAKVGFAGRGFGRVRNPSTEPAEYMERLILGKSRRPTNNRKALLVPSSYLRLDKFGNITKARRNIESYKGKPNYFVADATKAAKRNIAPGLYQVTGRKGKRKLKPLVLYKSKTKPYKASYPFKTLAEQSVHIHFRKRALVEIQRTIRKNFG